MARFRIANLLWPVAALLLAAAVGCTDDGAETSATAEPLDRSEATSQTSEGRTTPTETAEDLEAIAIVLDFFLAVNEGDYDTAVGHLTRQTLGVDEQDIEDMMEAGVRYDLRDVTVSEGIVQVDVSYTDSYVGGQGSGPISESLELIIEGAKIAEMRVVTSDTRVVVTDYIEALRRGDEPGANRLLGDPSLAEYGLEIDTDFATEVTLLSMESFGGFIEAHILYNDEEREADGWLPLDIRAEFEVRDGLIYYMSIIDERPYIEAERDTGPGEQVSISGTVDLEDLVALFENNLLRAVLEVGEVQAQTLDGETVASTTSVDPQGRFSLEVPAGQAYALKAVTTDVVSLWAVTPVVQRDLVQDVDLSTTYTAGLVAAHLLWSDNEGEVVEISQGLLDAISSEGAQVGHAQVETVRRIIDNPVLNAADYSPFTEVTETRFRAFGSGRGRHSPLQSLITGEFAPDPELSLFISAKGVVTAFMPGGEDRFEAGAVPGPADWYVGYPDVVHGGDTMVFASNAHCYVQSAVECINDNASAIFTQLLDSLWSGIAPGRLTPITLHASQPSFSYDQERIAFAGQPVPELGTINIYVMDSNGDNRTQLTRDSEPDVASAFPSWSPDGSQIVYVSNRSGTDDIWIVSADGTGNTNLTKNSGSLDSTPSFSPDGRRIAFTSVRDGDAEIFVMDRDGSNQRQLTDNGVQDMFPHWDRSGLIVIYTSGYTDEASTASFLGYHTLTGTVLDLGVSFDSSGAFIVPLYAGPIEGSGRGVLDFSFVRYALSGGDVEQEDRDAMGVAVTSAPSPGGGTGGSGSGSTNPLSDLRHEIFQVAPGFVPPVISFP